MRESERKEGRKKRRKDNTEGNKKEREGFLTWRSWISVGCKRMRNNNMRFSKKKKKQTTKCLSISQFCREVQKKLENRFLFAYALLYVRLSRKRYFLVLNWNKDTFSSAVLHPSGIRRHKRLAKKEWRYFGPYFVSFFCNLIRFS